MLEKIDADLKSALLGGDKSKTMTLRGLKSAILYEAVAQNKKDEGLSDDEITKVLFKEQKKRQEAIELYEKAGDADRTNAERQELEIINAYLPEQMGEAEIEKLVDDVLSGFDVPSIRDMGQIIGQVKQKAGAGADGATVARLVKAKLEGK